MNKTKFQDMLRKHDWYYRMSNNPTIFRKGESSERKILSAIREDQELKKIYDDFLDVKK